MGHADFGLPISELVRRAAGDGDLAAVQRHLSDGASVEATADVFFPGLTAIDVAAMNGHLEVVRALANAGADFQAARPRGPSAYAGTTSIAKAAFSGHSEVVKFLAASGADVATLNERDHAGRTPLMVASERLNEALARVLVELNVPLETRHFDKGYKSAIKETALLIAGRQGASEIAILLIRAGANIEAKSTEGDTIEGWALARKDDRLLHAIHEVRLAKRLQLAKMRRSRVSRR